VEDGEEEGRAEGNGRDSVEVEVMFRGRGEEGRREFGGDGSVGYG